MRDRSGYCRAGECRLRTGSRRSESGWRPPARFWLERVGVGRKTVGIVEPNRLVDVVLQPIDLIQVDMEALLAQSEFFVPNHGRVGSIPIPAINEVGINERTCNR